MKHAQFPKRVLVKDAWYQIVWKRDLAGYINATQGKKYKRLRGYCDGNEGKKLIYLQMGLTTITKVSTLIHEILHALSFEWKIKIAHRLIYRIELPLAYLVLDAMQKAPEGASWSDVMPDVQGTREAIQKSLASLGSRM